MYTNDYAFLFVHELVEPKTTVICLMQNIVYESVVTKGSCDKNKVQKKFVGDLFLSPLQREEEEEKNERRRKKVICDTYSTQTEILLSSQSTSHIGRNVESEYISIPGMMRISFLKKFYFQYLFSMTTFVMLHEKGR